jgi:hypothetical protein
MLDRCSEPGKFAEQRAIVTDQVFRSFLSVEKLSPATSAGSTLSAHCMLAAQHMVLATWQYLSTVLPDRHCGGKSSTRQDRPVPTVFQQHLAQTSLELAMIVKTK